MDESEIEEEEQNPSIISIPPETVEPTPSVVEEAQPEQEDKDGLSDMFEVPKTEDNDMDTDYLFETDGEDDMSDLTEIPSDLTDVSREDIMGDGFGGEPAAQQEAESKKYRITRPSRKVIQREPPPTSMGGVQY